MNSAPNHPITITMISAMNRMYRTMSCGMARMMRNATVARRCGDVPAYHMSTRLVGISIAGFVMGPLPHAARRPAHAER